MGREAHFGRKRDLDPRVRLDQAHEHLNPNVTKNIIDVRPDERIPHNARFVVYKWRGYVCENITSPESEFSPLSIFSNSLISFLWNALTRFVMASI